MNKQKKFNACNESGITLVSLVVTIVVMLILAGVSISMVVGQNGVGTRAQYAAIDTETANIQDALSQGVASAQAAYQSDWALDKKLKESPKYYTDDMLADGGLDVSKVSTADLKYYKKTDVVSVNYYPASSTEGTKAWCKITGLTNAMEIASDSTEETDFIVGKYDVDATDATIGYIFVIDLEEGKVSVYPLSGIDDRKQAATTAGEPVASDTLNEIGLPAAE